MQLFILLALLLSAGGDMDAGNLLDKARPVIEALGGSNAQNALKQAKDLTEIFSQLKSVNGGNTNKDNARCGSSDMRGGNDMCGGNNNGGGNGAGYKFPLAPVANIMDKNITYCLSRYLSESGPC